MTSATGYRATTTPGQVERFDFERRALRPDDVEVRITHCGVCHTDLHALGGSAEGRGDVPLVPGPRVRRRGRGRRLGRDALRGR